MSHVPHLIDGARSGTSGAEHLPVHDPATGAVQGSVAMATDAEVDAAVAAAAAAFPGWRDTSLVRRQRVLFRYRELLENHRDELARIVVNEHGKTLDDARGEVQRGIEVVEFACGLPHLLKGEASEEVSGGVDTASARYPLGVCAGITPFNFPVMVPLWMFPMAIACGNSFVLKPSEKDPSASVFAAELFHEAGLPNGVLNVLHGSAAAVDRLLTHPSVAAISFVGSTPVARHVYELSARSGKRVQALGGAKNHMVVLPDAHLEAAADAAVSAAFGSAGERCMAISVVVAVAGIGDELVAMIEKRMAELRVGPGNDPASDMGPLISAGHRDRVAEYVEAGAAEGATVVVDGRQVTVAGGDDGYFLGPTLLDHVRPQMSVYRDEIFGPVLCVVRVDSHDAAIRLINDNPYGNGTAVFTSSGGAARRFQRGVEVGMVGINVPLPVPLAFYSFGGWRSSIFGAHDIYGPAAVDFYTRQKVVVSRWPDVEPSPERLALSFPTHV